MGCQVLDGFLKADVIEEELRLENLGILLLYSELSTPKGIAKVEHHSFKMVVKLTCQFLVYLRNLAGVYRLGRGWGNLISPEECSDLIIDQSNLFEVCGVQVKLINRVLLLLG